MDKKNEKRIGFSPVKILIILFIVCLTAIISLFYIEQTLQLPQPQQIFVWLPVPPERNTFIPLYMVQLPKNGIFKLEIPLHFFKIISEREKNQRVLICYTNEVRSGKRNPLIIEYWMYDNNRNVFYHSKDYIYFSAYRFVSWTIALYSIFDGDKEVEVVIFAEPNKDDIVKAKMVLVRLEFFIIAILIWFIISGIISKKEKN